MTDDELTCPLCGNEAYQRLDHGEMDELDTIGTHRVCATDEGTFFHAHGQFGEK